MNKIMFPARSDIPPVFLQLLLALGQIALLTLLCALAGVFTDTDSTHEYFGHLLIGGALVGLGALAMVGGLSERRLTRIEGLMGIAVWAIWLIGDIIEHPPLGIFRDLDHAGNEHIGIVMLVGAAGLFTLIMARRMADLKGFHVIVVVALLALILPGHVHNGASALQGLSHNATGVLMVLAVIFRFFGRPTEYGASFICAGYLLFSGQTGLPPFGDAIGQTGISWVCYWGGLGLLVAGLYLLIYRPKLAEARA